MPRKKATQKTCSSDTCSKQKSIKSAYFKTPEHFDSKDKKPFKEPKSVASKLKTQKSSSTERNNGPKNTKGDKKNKNDTSAKATSDTKEDDTKGRGKNAKISPLLSDNTTAASKRKGNTKDTSNASLKTSSSKATRKRKAALTLSEENVGQAVEPKRKKSEEKELPSTTDCKKIEANTDSDDDFMDVNEEDGVKKNRNIKDICPNSIAEANSEYKNIHLNNVVNKEKKLPKNLDHNDAMAVLLHMEGSSKDSSRMFPGTDEHSEETTDSEEEWEEVEGNATVDKLQ